MEISAVSTLSSTQVPYTRKITREAFLEAHEERRHAIRLARRKLRADPESILGIVLISIAIRLAVWLITKWIEENFTIHRMNTRAMNWATRG